MRSRRGLFVPKVGPADATSRAGWGVTVRPRFFRRSMAAVVAIVVSLLVPAGAHAAPAPSVPTALRATVSGDTVTLTWTASKGGSGVLEYDIHVSSVSGFTADDDTLYDIAATTTYEDLEAPAGRWYYRVVAVDEAGNASAPSAQVAADVPDVVAPTAPGALTASVSGSTVTLTWTASTDEVGVVKYEVQRSSGSATPAVVGSSSSTSYADSSVPRGTWTYRVIAIDAAGNRSPPAEATGVSVLLPKPPGAPTELAAITGGSATWLSWRMTDYGSPAADQYVVTIEPGGQQLMVSGTSVRVTGLAYDVSYTFNVYAKNSVGQSPATTSAPFVVAAPSGPPVVTGLTLTPDRQRVVLSWTNPPDAGFAGVVIWRTSRNADGSEEVVEVYRGTGTTATSTGLLERRSHWFTVVAAAPSPSYLPVEAALLGSYLYRSRSASRVTFGGRVIHRSMLSRAGEVTVVDGRAVSLYERRPRAGGWTRACTTTTSIDGTATCTTKPTRNTEYEWRFAGGNDGGTNYGSTTSRPYVVRVAPKVSLGASAATVSAGRSVTLSGSVAPRHARQKVYLQRFTRGAWRTVERGDLSARSTYSFRVAPRGTFSYRVYKTGDADHTWGVSAVRRVTIG